MFFAYVKNESTELEIPLDKEPSSNYFVLIKILWAYPKCEFLECLKVVFARMLQSLFVLVKMFSEMIWNHPIIVSIESLSSVLGL